MDLAGYVDLRTVLDHQSGVVSRKQVLEVATANDLRRWVRRRELVRVHDGVYVNHTGPLSWPNRAWAGVLRYWPAALALESATRLAGDPIHLAVAEGRTFPSTEPGLELHRLTGFEDRIQWNRTPPRQRYEDALLSICNSSRSREQALELVLEACRSRRTTPGRLHEELTSRSNVRDREWLLGVLGDAAAGVQSVLERAYLRKVERAHGLPRSERQLRGDSSGKVVWRDSLYRAFAIILELDGLLWHDGTRRWDDMDRDLRCPAPETRERRGTVPVRDTWWSQLARCLPGFGPSGITGPAGTGAPARVACSPPGWAGWAHGRQNPRPRCHAPARRGPLSRKISGR